jgi:uncharacterized protein YigA (DUF484 family)
VAPDSNANLYDELVRLRDRLHALADRVTTLELYGEHMKKTLDRVETQVNRLSTAEEIADAVAKHDQTRNRLTLKPAQKYSLLAALGIVAANLILRLAGIEGLH